MHMYLPHGGRLTISNYVMKTRTTIKSIFINGMDLDCVMRYGNLSVVS